MATTFSKQDRLEMIARAKERDACWLRYQRRWPARKKPGSGSESCLSPTVRADKTQASLA